MLALLVFVVQQTTQEGLLLDQTALHREKTIQEVSHLDQIVLQLEKTTQEA